MKTQTLKRLECAWLLRDFAWALKRLADRYERCCTENPNDENERKAQVWLERSRERLVKFRASRREYFAALNFDWITRESHRMAAAFGLDPPPPVGEFKTTFDKPDEAQQEIKRIMNIWVPQPKRNPWRAGIPPASGRKFMFIRPGFVLIGDGWSSKDCKAWRPA